MAKVTQAAQAAVAAVEHELVVVHDFPGYVKGQVISEAEKVAELIKSEWQSHFVKRVSPKPEDTAAS